MPIRLTIALYAQLLNCVDFRSPQALAGVLAGALVSGVQLAVSMSNTGGAWDNAKKVLVHMGRFPAFAMHAPHPMAFREA